MKLLLFEIERFEDSEWMIFVCLDDIEAIAKYGLMRTKIRTHDGLLFKRRRALPHSMNIGWYIHTMPHLQVFLV